MSLKTKQICAGSPLGYSTVIVFGIVSTMLVGVSADICVDRVNGWRYQDALDCHGFFVCIKNISYQAYCDYGEKFDVDSQRCVKGKCPPCERCDSQCGSSTPSTQSTTPTHSTRPTSPTPTVPWNSCRGHSDGSVYGDVYDCTKFYFCVSGREYTAHCTGNTYFDKNLQACYDADKVDCVPVSTDSTTSSSTKAPTTSTSTTTTIRPLDPYSCEGRPNNYIFRDPKNCATFYYCIDGIKKTNTCPHGEYFDTNINACRESNDVYCPSDATTTTTTLAPTTTPSTTTTIRPLDSCEGRPNGYIFGDPNDCARFYYCLRGIRKVYTCPDGLYFDSNLNKCMISRDVYCPSDATSSSTKGPTTSSTATLWPIDPSCYGRPDGYIYRDSGDCATFHYCIDGIKRTYTCPDGELFDTNMNACRESNDVYCPSDATTTTTTLAPTTTPSTTTTIRPLDSCEGRPNGYIFGDPNDCARFYYCLRGIRKVYTCPDGLYFDSNLNKCMISRDVYCPSDATSSSTKGPTTSSTATLWPIDPSCYGRPDGYIYRDSSDCATFHYCIDGIKKTYTCPDGELFDTNMNACRESNDVYCPSDVTTTTPAPTTTSSTTTTTTPAPTTTTSTTTTTTPAPTTTTPKPTTITTTTTVKDHQVDPNVKDCLGLPNGSFFRNKDHCRIYYVCRDGEAVKHSCTPNQWFNDIYPGCNLREFVKCAAGID